MNPYPDREMKRRNRALNFEIAINPFAKAPNVPESSPDTYPMTCAPYTNMYVCCEEIE